MEIYVLDCDQVQAAAFYCDEDLTTSCETYSQLLSTVVRLTGVDQGLPLRGEDSEAVRWLMGSVWHFVWLRRLLRCVNEEYRYRFGRPCETAKIGLDLPIPLLVNDGFSIPPQTVPEPFRRDDVVLANRLYYRWKRAGEGTYKRRRPPAFLVKELSEDELFNI